MDCINLLKNVWSYNNYFCMIEIIIDISKINRLEFHTKDSVIKI
jgi:hypothetical protein